jgi:hypothetical protein
MNSFLWITAQELAVYQAVEARGGDASEAWELCHKAIRLRMERVPRWKRAGDFETRSVVGDGVAFDHGVDYLRCGNLELAREVGADAFAPYLCLSDIALSEGLGWGLIRTQAAVTATSASSRAARRGSLRRRPRCRRPSSASRAPRRSRSLRLDRPRSPHKVPTPRPKPEKAAARNLKDSGRLDW